MVSTPSFHPTDLVFAVLLPLVTYILKMIFRPSVKDAERVIELSALLIVFILRVVRKWYRDRHPATNHLRELENKAFELKNKLKNDRIALG